MKLNIGDGYVWFDGVKDSGIRLIYDKGDSFYCVFNFATLDTYKIIDRELERWVRNGEAILL